MHRTRLGIPHKPTALLLMLLVLLVALPGAVAGQTPASPAPVEATFSDYTIDVRLDAEKRTISGTLDVTWTNTTGDEQLDLWFRLYPNSGYYGDGETRITAAAIEGAEVAYALTDDPTVLQVSAPKPIAPDDVVTATLAFTTVVPEDVASGFGVFQRESASGIWNLANWYPILAGYEPGVGWYLAPPTDFGDPTFAETSTYTVTLELPADLTLVSSGETVATQLGFAGTNKVIVETGPAREFAMTLLPGETDSAEASAGDTTVRVTLPAGSSAPGLPTFMAETAAAALVVYEGWMGEYPSPELDLSVANLSGATGVSWSGLTWFGLAQITADGKLSEEEKTGLAFVILHEVGHQWIADIVGSNNNDHGFMSEGLVNALAVLSAAEIYGEERSELYLASWVAGPYSSLLNDERDGVADAPLTDESNGVIRSLLIYGKAAVGFIAIHNEIGSADFLAGLEEYAAGFRFGISTPDDLQAAFEAASGEGLDALWTFWFEEKSATRADLDEVLAAFEP